MTLKAVLRQDRCVCRGTGGETVLLCCRLFCSQECLHPQGRREKQLHGALELRKAAILSSLTSSKQETALKRFYGSR